jgi:2-phospho-L-lactate transferase/gluconeogenesis factor (CofD/UPF0052 family)
MYICNVATEEGETDGFAVADHLDALEKHTFPGIVDFVVANDAPRALGPRLLGEPVAAEGRPLEHATLVLADLVDPEHALRHEPERLARTIFDVYRNRRREKHQTMAALGRWPRAWSRERNAE